jgi:UDP-N-acetylglucosamine 2-epimerase (non-hydrolysing)
MDRNARGGNVLGGGRRVMTAGVGGIAIIVGTRPEIIKLAEIVRLLGREAALVHTGQHWDQLMSGTFMESLGMPPPEVTLQVGGSSRATQIAQTVEGVDNALQILQPRAVVVQGDTNSALGGALAANACEVPLVHVEAGLRSSDRRMPEEHNRVVADHLADLCLAPTEANRALLLGEGIANDRIVVTGNTVVGAVARALESGEAGAASLIDRLRLQPDAYIVVTLHRPENTDTEEQLRNIVSGLCDLGREARVVWPMHPRTRRRLHEFGVSWDPEQLMVIDPIGYAEFVALCARAALTISDSGGIQEEASVWKRPVVVVRRSTERPEVLGTFAHLTDNAADMVTLARTLLHDREHVHSELAGLPTPYGDRNAALKCVQAIRGAMGR